MAEFKAGDGVRIHYEVGGREDGPPLVFSNSLGTNFHMWDRQAEEAAGMGFRVIRYDQRGHGQSEALKGSYTIERLALDVIDLLDVLNIEQTAFCGLSMGGMTGIRLGKEHPRRFSRMALCNTAAFMPPRDMWEARIKAVSEGGMKAVCETVLERWFTAAFRQKEPAEVERVRKMLLTTKPGGYIGCSAAIRDMDQRDFLGTIENPVFVVIGQHDPATTPEAGEYIVTRVPGAQKAVLDAAHLSNIEQPEAFNSAVLGFFAGKQ